jgi:hypothetical protein
MRHDYWYDEYVERISIRMSEGKQTQSVAKRDTYAEISERLNQEGFKPHQRIGFMSEIKERAVREGVIDEY